MKKVKMVVVVMVITWAICLGNTVKAQDEAFNLDQLNMMRDFISMMNEYLSVSAKWVNSLKDDDLSIYLIAESMKEIYEQKGEKTKVIPELRKLAEQNKDRKVVHKAILFKIKDIYKDNKEYDKALEVLWEIAAIK